MNVVVIYESLTGNTRRAAYLITAELVRLGHQATHCPVTQIDFAALSRADLVIIGTWTDGAILIGQRPGRAGRLRKLPVLDRKRCVVYCTYAVDPGRTLGKLQAIVEERGGDVLGGMAMRRNQLPEAVVEFVGRFLDAMAV